MSVDNVINPLNTIRLTVHERSIHYGDEPYKCSVCAKPLISNGVLANMSEFILERNGTNVENVAETLSCAQNLVNIGEFMLERNS